ncbi:MAG: ABC transporter permease subunit [Armatimonadota bacterium]|nr:ABC transporter permease subunit [Armatimonadota bacterium]
MGDVREGVLEPGGPLGGVRLADRSRASLGRRRRLDRVARRVVALGGVLVITSILAILFVIAAEVVPLVQPPFAGPRAKVRVPLSMPPLAVGVDEYRELVYLVTARGVSVVRAVDGTVLRAVSLDGLGAARIVATSALGRGPFGVGLSDGRVIPVEVRFNVRFQDGRRVNEAELVAGTPIDVSVGRSLRHLAYAVTPRGPLVVAVTGPRELTVAGVRESRPLAGPSRREAVRATAALRVDGEVTQVVMDGRGDYAYAGTSAGEVVSVALADPSAPVQRGIVAAGGSSVSISALGLLLGDRTLLVGDAAGGVSTWLILPDVEPAGLLRAHVYAPHTGPVVAFAPSRRDKGFLSVDASGGVHVNYATTGRTLLVLRAGIEGAGAMTYAPKADGFLIAGPHGQLQDWDLHNPHPQVTLRTLFGKVLYEGYREPAYVWQSTGGTDDFEEKLSLTPLVFGTLKGTFYALLVAVPLAILGALYASQFMHPTLRGIVKPVVEIMAALPSVVLGFLAGLWLAPMLARVVPGVFLMPVFIPLCVLAALLLWRWVPARVRRRLRPGTEVALLLPVVCLGGWLALRAGSAVEAALLGGDYHAWLLRTLGITYDQRNSLVVGFAMGFAVIPIIFTISEDALSSVPPSLAAGSLALGATRWQTALRVVLPTASPGIFSAVMIGFGRAVGETMIVLMATGNTPVMDWSIFNGFRALSANVAVELPEAPVGQTLYRVLFLAALLLFALTFVVNTAAEIVRLRLRRRYQTL